MNVSYHSAPDKGGDRANLGIIFCITPLKHMLYPSLEPACQDGANEGSQHVFVGKEEKLSLDYPQYPLISTSEYRFRFLDSFVKKRKEKKKNLIPE